MPPLSFRDRCRVVPTPTLIEWVLHARDMMRDIRRLPCSDERARLAIRLDAARSELAARYAAAEASDGGRR